jgi:hypothetical protein
MKAKPSIKVEHDESPSIVGDVVNSTTNHIARSEGGLINVDNGTSTAYNDVFLLTMLQRTFGSKQYNDKGQIFTFSRNKGFCHLEVDHRNNYVS